jgi:predicted  nucleic acid-binding Zn-ribbon protein
LDNGVKRTLELTINQAQFKIDAINKHTRRMEQHVEEVFKIIPNNVQEGNIPIEEKIENITHAMEAYKSHIAELTERLAPNTTPEVRKQGE